MTGPDMSPMHLVLVGGSDATDVLTAEAERIVPLALDVLVARGLAPSTTEVSISLVDDAQIRQLNHQFRGKDSATDVLSFSQLEGDGSAGDNLPAGVPVPLGDIVVSVPRMQEQAVEYGHSVAREFGYLLVHGLLHLLGFDHETPEDAAAMRAAEEDVLAAAGLTRDAESE
jgi:probable rRNA maturation factor